MKKIDDAKNNIYLSLNRHININVTQILNDGVVIDNSGNIIRAIKLFISDIENNNIDMIELSENTDIEKTIENIFHCFVIALVEVDPVDFEGNDPLDVSILMETTSGYICDSILLGQINGVSIIK